MKRPIDEDAGQPARMTPRRLSHELENWGVKIAELAVRGRKLAVFTGDGRIDKVASELIRVAQLCSDVSIAVLVGVSPIVDEFRDATAGQGERPLLDQLEKRSGPRDEPDEPDEPEAASVPSANGVHHDQVDDEPDGIPDRTAEARMLCPDCGGFLDQPNTRRLRNTKLACHIGRDGKARRMRMTPESVRSRRENPPEKLDLDAYANRTIEEIEEEDDAEDDSPGGGYGPAHPWYYKLGGKLLAPEEIEAAEIKPESIMALNRLPKDPKKRRAKLEKLLADEEQSLMHDMDAYREMVDQWPDGRTDQEKAADDSDVANSYHCNLALTHNHVCYGKGCVETLRKMMAAIEEPAPTARKKRASAPPIPPGSPAAKAIHALHTDDVAALEQLEADGVLVSPRAPEPKPAKPALWLVLHGPDDGPFERVCLVEAAEDSLEEALAAAKKRIGWQVANFEHGLVLDGPGPDLSYRISSADDYFERTEPEWLETPAKHERTGQSIRSNAQDQVPLECPEGTPRLYEVKYRHPHGGVGHLVNLRAINRKAANDLARAWLDKRHPEWPDWRLDVEPVDEPTAARRARKRARNQREVRREFERDDHKAQYALECQAPDPEPEPVS
jgi:hypothetical protein